GGGLAGAGGTHQGHVLAGHGGDGYVVQDDGSILPVGERHVQDLDAAGQGARVGLGGLHIGHDLQDRLGPLDDRLHAHHVDQGLAELGEGGEERSVGGVEGDEVGGIDGVAVPDQVARYPEEGQRREVGKDVVVD